MQMTYSYTYHGSKDLNSLDVLQACLIDLKKWMALNFLQLNTEKTEVVIIGQSSSKNQIELALYRVFPNNKQVVRNLFILILI